MTCKLVVVIPVGPGHERFVRQAVESVENAWRFDRGAFTDVRVEIIYDPAGEGRSAARNRGLEKPADWHFLLDADDVMTPWALSWNSRQHAATFGAVWLDRKRSIHDRYPLTREDLFTYGPLGALSMGCFVRGDLGLRFNEQLHVGEDYDFYLRLPNFLKVNEPLVRIGYHRPSAAGPNSSADANWIEVCTDIIAQYAVTA